MCEVNRQTHSVVLQPLQNPRGKGIEIHHAQLVAALRLAREDRCIETESPPARLENLEDGEGANPRRPHQRPYWCV